VFAIRELTSRIAGFFRVKAKSLAMKTGSSPLRIAVAAMLVALSLVISILPSLPGPITKFSGFPLLLGGLLVGPRTGFAVGCLTDLIGFMLRPTGWFFPGFTLTQGLTALIPAFMSRGKDPYTWREETSDLKEPKGGNLGSYLRLLLIFGLTQLVTSVLLVSLFTSKVVAGTPWLYELTSRAIAQATHVPIYAFLALAVLRSLSETDLYKRLIRARR
jgi:riboflavin transporter